MRVLVAAHTVLAVAAGARAGVQLATRAGEAPVPYALSAVAAVVYLVLAVALRRRGRWLDLAAVAAAAELAGVLWVGTAERLGAVAWPDQTVWSGYGAGYGFAPLVLPVAALVVLARRSRSGPGYHLPDWRLRSDSAVQDIDIRALERELDAALSCAAPAGSS